MGVSAQRDRRAEWSHGTRRAVLSLAVFEPYSGPRWPLGIQAGLAMGVPVAIGALVGELGPGLLAATGGFTALHVTNLNTRERVRALPLVGLFLFATVVLASMLAPYPALASVGLVVVTIIGAVLSFGYRMGAPGPMFVTLAYGLANHVTEVVDGERLVEPASLIGAVAAGILLALVITAFPLARAANRRLGVRRLQDVLPRFNLGREGRELLLRVVAVAVLGTLISVTLVDPERAYWTVGAGVAVIGARAGRGDAARRGLHRIVGTCVGAGVYLFLGALNLMPLELALVLGALQFVIQLVVVRHYALALMFITPMVLLLTGAATGAGGSMGTLSERVIDTAIGAVLGTVSGLVHRRVKESAPDANSAPTVATQ